MDVHIPPEFVWMVVGMVYLELARLAVRLLRFLVRLLRCFLVERQKASRGER